MTQTLAETEEAAPVVRATRVPDPGSRALASGPVREDPPLLTDMANARRFAEEHRDSLRYDGKSRHWLVWTGTHWRQDETGEVQRRAKETVTRLHRTIAARTDLPPRYLDYAIDAQRGNRIAAMIALAKSEPGIPVTPDQLDTDPWLLNVENGTLDLRTGDLRAHRPEDLITKVAPVRYDANAASPKWLEFLDQIMDGDQDLIRFLQKVFGYALTGDAREQCVFIAHGGGANGKSTAFTAVATVVGGYAQHTPTETLLVKRGDSIPNDVARLRGARLVTAAEAECNRRLAEALVKQLTGGDKIAARFLHGEFFEFAPTFKLFLAVNHKPVIQGTDHAIWRRIRLIPFTVTIPTDKQDRTLPDKLRAERAGILAWAVRGCLRWQEEGLEPPQAVKDATAEYRDEMDTVGSFIDERCVRDPDAHTPSAWLYEAYKTWCFALSEIPMAKADFGARLAEKGFTPGRTSKGRFWRGLAVVPVTR